MCGIAGVVSKSDKPIDQRVLRQMCSLLHHRGPDGSGISVNGRVGFAHTRLAILDPQHGQQPLVDRELGLMLTYNGEVYNYKELRNEMPSAAPFVTGCDTEVVLKSFGLWGVEACERFRGMFAYALYDTNENAVYLVRDRLGIKPLYYAETDEAVVFASEIPAILAHPSVGRDINSDALAHYLYLQYAPTPTSIYQGIKKLKPGHILRINLADGSISESAYWELEPRVVKGNEDARLEEFDCLIDETIKMYLRSDAPFGSFLSGGVDSSAVTAWMSKQMRDRVQTFTIGFKEELYSESVFAAEASATLGTIHHEDIIGPEAVLNAVGKLAVHFGEPFGDSSAVPTYFLSRSAASQVKMVLSGDGGDETFAGYNNYPAILDRIRRQPSALTRMAANMSERCIGSARREQIFGALIETPDQVHERFRKIYSPQQVNSLMSDKVNFVPNHLPEPKYVLDEVQRFQYQDVGTYLLDDILTKVDRMSMANSLEVRVPLLDHEVVEFAFSLDHTMRLGCEMKSGTVKTKSLLKRAAAPHFQAGFLDRKKMGFGIPVTEWLLDPLREMVCDTLLDWTSELYDYISYGKVEEVVKGFYASKGHNYGATHVWLLLMLKLWFDEVHLRDFSKEIPTTSSEQEIVTGVAI